MNKEVTEVDLWDSMSPATPFTSTYAEAILKEFAGTTREEASGPIGQEALRYARSLGGLATFLQDTTGKHPTRGGPADINANHLFGSVIKLDRSLPKIH